MAFVSTRCLSDDEVKRESFGRVLKCISLRSSWREQLGTLSDPRIFGHRHNWRCICGETAVCAQQFAICPMCGTPAGNGRRLIRTRFGHIDLGCRVEHPLIRGALISVIPVLPLWYRRPLGYTADLDGLYAIVLRALDESQVAVASAVTRLFCNGWCDSRIGDQQSACSLLHCLMLSPKSTSASRVVFLRGLGLDFYVSK